MKSKLTLEDLYQKVSEITRRIDQIEAEWKREKGKKVLPQPKGMTMSHLHSRFFKRKRIWSYYLDADPKKLGAIGDFGDRKVGDLTVREFSTLVPRHFYKFNLVRGLSPRSWRMIWKAVDRQLKK